ncbi:hypothetical protein [Neolewinella sp.]|uniref:hypothetical protein n=1 Tax=Neolewinella sp. TaxID=2993543 RepID=UPI003B5243E2
MTTYSLLLIQGDDLKGDDLVFGGLRNAKQVVLKHCFFGWLVQIESTGELYMREAIQKFIERPGVERLTVLGMRRILDDQSHDSNEQ